MNSIRTFLLLCAAGAAMATAAQVPGGDLRQAPRIVLSDRSAQAIQLSDVRVFADIEGRSAETRIEMVLYNPNRRQLEGELQFPLLDNQHIAGFSLDVNGVLREAVPVEKARGSAVFEDIVRGNVDPGLLEHTAGNNFKLRIYPIPANGTRRVQLRIAETLVDRDGRARYRLPLAFGTRIASFSLNIHVAGGDPQVQNSVLGPLHFERDKLGYSLSYQRSDFAGDGVFNVGVATSRGATVYRQAMDGRSYFVADIPVESQVAARRAPARIGLIWDSSASGAARDHGRELELLDGYFRSVRKASVRLTRIRDVAEPTKSYEVVDGDWSRLRSDLSQTDYDGATNLGAFQPEADVAEYLLFSDGIANYGDRPFAQVGVPVHTVSAAIKADPAWLRHIAARSGGRAIDLLQSKAAEAVRALLTETTHIAVLDSAGIEQAVLLNPFPQGGRVQVAGIAGEGALLRLRITHPHRAAVVREISLAGGAQESRFAAGQWAQMRIEQLDAEFSFHRAEIRRLGQQFKLISRETSLIVLENVRDYARYEIAPPSELRKEYEQLLAAGARQAAADRRSHLENIVRQFAEKAAWWQRDFPRDTPVPPEKAKIAMAAAGAAADAAAPRALLNNTSGASQPQFTESRVAREAPVQALAMPPATPQANRVERIEVTGSNIAAAKIMAVEAPPLTASIRLQKWQPDAAYARRMRDTDADHLYRVYLDEKPGYANSTAFFLDAADIFFERGQPVLGLRVLSNLAEMDLENRHILRVLAYRLRQAKQAKLAIPVLRKVLELAPEEPQSYRDLGLALADDRQMQAAVDALTEVVMRPWAPRFPEIELITLAELNALVATTSQPVDTSKLDARLLKNLPLDLRAVLSWDADNTDIDLWVTDPNGEKAFYGHRLTYQGGRMSADFTGGYGPEEFSLKRAKPGKYKVEAQYFGDRRQNVSGATTLSVRLSTHFGSANQHDDTVTLRLKDRNDQVFVGEFEIK